MTPLPTALRLLDVSGDVQELPRPPFGLPGWTQEGHPDQTGRTEPADVAVLLPSKAGGSNGVGAIVTVAALLPDPSQLRPGTLVIVLAGAPPRSLVRRLLGPRTPPLDRSLRAGALLCRGYVDVGAGIEAVSGDDLVWGYAQHGVTDPV